MVSIYLMPVSVSVSITMTTVFFTAILAYLIQAETLSWREVTTIISGFIGVLMITSPTLFNSEPKGSEFQHREKEDLKEYPYYWVGAFFGLLFALFSAMNFITIRDMSGNMYVSLKTYYFGVFSTALTLLICAFTDPGLFAVWRIGTANYPISKGSFIGCLCIGTFSWISQEAMSIALGVVKSGTVAGFYNIALCLSYMTDAFYFNRDILWSDYTGALIIILSTSLQGYISNRDYEASISVQ